MLHDFVYMRVTFIQLLKIAGEDNFYLLFGKYSSISEASTTLQLAIWQYTHMKHLKISCQKHKIDSLLLSSRCMTNYTKSFFFFYMLISFNKGKWLRI